MNIFGYDTETHRFRPGCMSPPVVCATYDADGAGNHGIIVGRDAIRRFTHETLDWAIEGAGENIIAGSYIAYDFSVFLANFWDDKELVRKIFAAYEARAILCTQVVEKLLDIAEGGLQKDERAYSLGSLASKYLDVTLDKSGPVRTSYSELDGVPLAQWPKDAVDYAIDDAKASRGVTVAQLLRASEMEYSLPDAPEQSYADFCLRLLSNWGVRTEESRIIALDNDTQAKLAILKTKLVGHGLYTTRTPKRGKFAGIEQGKKSVKVMQQLVTEAFTSSGKRVPLTLSGRVSTEAVVLEDLNPEQYPQIADWLDFIGLEKTASTYIKRLYDGIHLPIHARFKSLVNTGRNSSSDPNLHNVPRLPGVRECYKARPGYVLVSSDFNSQEMRAWAEVCESILGWSKLAERYREDPDFDPHIAMAAGSLLGCSEEEAKARLKAGDKEAKDARQASKIANFGLPGGMGVNGLIRYARGYGVRWEDPNCPRCILGDDYDRNAHGKLDHACFAQGVREGWRRTWPEAAEYFRHVHSVVENVGYVIQLYSERRRGGIGFTDGANTYFQGLAADASKAALCEVTRRCYSVESSWLYGCRPIVLIHDEILMEAPEEYAHEAATEMVEVMEAAQAKFTPHVPPRASPALMRNWSKGAEAKYDLGGRLIPVEDAPVKVKGAA